MPKHTSLPKPTDQKLVALSIGAIPFEGDKESRELPERMLVMPWGAHDTNKGRLIVNETTTGVLAHNQRAAKFDRIAFDFQHNTVKAKPSDEPVKVAGWGTPEIVPGEGIYLSAIEYTDEGKETLPGGHYPDISPTIVPNEAGEVIFIDSVGAVRQGEIDGLVLFSPAPESKSAAALTALNAGGLLTLESSAAETDWRGIAIEALNAAGASLSESAEDTDVLTAVTEMRDTVSKISKSNPDKKTMSAEDTEFDKRLKALEAKSTDNERQAILDGATRAGKVIPLSAEKLKTIDPELLAEMVENLPAGQVPLDSEIEGVEDPKISLSSGGTTNIDQHVMKQVGVSEDDLKKYAS